MAAAALQTQSPAPAWSVRLAADLTASDASAKSLVAGLTEDQLNWQAAPGAWSIGQCLDHLCLMNDVYLPPVAAALKDAPDGPVDEIVLGWFGAWFLRSFVEPSPSGKRAPAPSKIRPAQRIPLAVLDRFLSGNQSWREVIVNAHNKNVNRARFWNPFVPGIRFTAGTGLQILTAHERRHLLQAQRVRDDAHFPAG